MTKIDLYSNLDSETTMALLRALLQDKPGVHVDSLDPENPVVRQAQEISDLFTQAVDFLRRGFGNPHINDLMAFVWDLVHYQIIPVGIGPVRTVTVAIMNRRIIDSATILLPPNWARMFRTEPQFQLGALVYAGAKVRDFYQKIAFTNDGSDLETRALAYEAEFLRVLQANGVAMAAYQTGVLRQHPDGVGTWAYPSPKFDPGSSA